MPSNPDPPAGFDFTAHVRRVCEDMVARVAPLSHIDMARVAVCFCKTRLRTQQGVYAKLTPLRFLNGSLETVRRGQRWTIQRLIDSSGREMLYILGFYLPRFLDLSFREKLATIAHELWHISPRFDGDVRRLGGRCYAHGSSRRRYDQTAGQLVDRWLASSPEEGVYAFLRCDYRELLGRYGGVYGNRARNPRLIRAADRPLNADSGLCDYQSRWYDPLVGRMASVKTRRASAARR